MKNREKKKGISPTLILGFILDLIVFWYLYGLFKVGNQIWGYGITGIYGFLRIALIVRTIKRWKLRKEFNELYPED